MASRRAVVSDGPNCFPESSDRNPLCALLSTRRALCGRGWAARAECSFATGRRACTGAAPWALRRRGILFACLSGSGGRPPAPAIHPSKRGKAPAICGFVRRAVLLAWRAVGGGDKKRSVACRVNRDVGREPGSAAGLLDDVRGSSFAPRCIQPRPMPAGLPA